MDGMGEVALYVSECAFVGKCMSFLNMSSVCFVGNCVFVCVSARASLTCPRGHKMSGNSRCQAQFYMFIPSFKCFLCKTYVSIFPSTCFMRICVHVLVNCVCVWVSGWGVIRAV